MSIYEIVPEAVVEPAVDDDIVAVLRYCNENRTSLTPRAGASNTGGSAIGAGIVLLPVAVTQSKAQSTSDDDTRERPATTPGSHPVRIIDERKDEIVVEVPAGLRHDRLQRVLLDRGFHLPSDPSSGPLSYIGANVATRASGAHALRHGAIDGYLESLVVVLADGTRIDTSVPQSVPTHIRDGLTDIASRLISDPRAAATIESKQRLKTASGYNLQSLLDPAGPDLNRLFAGSVGTLGVIETVRLRCPRKPSGERLLVLSFSDEIAACEAVPAIVHSDPAACEILNSFCVQLLAGEGAGFARDCGAMLVVEYAGERRADSAACAEREITGATGLSGVYHMEDPLEQRNFWKLRKSMMLRLRNRNDRRAALSVVNDIGVPVESMPAFLRSVEPLFAARDVPLPIYGHAADGNLHLRPLYDTGDDNVSDTIRETADGTYELVLSLDGTITAEHGMGRLRSPYLRREWGESLYGVMARIKRLFDPRMILNTDAMFWEGELLTHSPWER
jgi:glycolate oxidase